MPGDFGSSYPGDFGRTVNGHGGKSFFAAMAILALGPEPGKPVAVRVLIGIQVTWRGCLSEILRGIPRAIQGRRIRAFRQALGVSRSRSTRLVVPTVQPLSFHSKKKRIFRMKLRHCHFDRREKSLLPIATNGSPGYPMIPLTSCLFLVYWNVRSHCPAAGISRVRNGLGPGAEIKWMRRPWGTLAQARNDNWWAESDAEH